MTIIDLSLYALFILIIAVLIAYVVLTLPVGMEYFKAALSKDKYALLIVDKNGVFRIRSAKFRNGSATLSQGMAKFLKTGLHGSLSLGSIRCDLVHSSVAPMIEDSTLGVFKELKKAGIEDIQELTARCNQAALIKDHIINPKTLSSQEKERIAYVSNYVKTHITLLSPVIYELNTHDMIKNCSIDPVVLAADTEESTALIASQYSKMMGKKSPKDNGPDGKIILIIGVVIIACALGVAFFMMG
jgi:hypothetical protein